MQQHGFGGRIEEAFSASKAKGKAAFVSFVTAGYPTKDGFKVSNACFYHIQRPLVTTIAVFNLSS